MPGTNTNPNVDPDLLDPPDPEAKDSGKGPGEGSEPSADEVAAAKKGWVPKDQYEGDASKWVDAATFIERGNNFNSVLQKKVKKLEDELSNFRGTAKAFEKFHRESMEGKQRELDAALKTLKAQHREAIRDGDDDAADAIEGRMDVINGEKAAVSKSLETPPANPDSPPGKTKELTEWVEAGNEWFETDLPLQKYAVALAQEMVEKGEKSRGREFLDKVAAQVKEDFPQKFGNPRRQRPGAAESGNAAPQAKSGRTAKDLPEEDQKLMKEFIKEGWTTEKKFLEEYRW